MINSRCLDSINCITIHANNYTQLYLSSKMALKDINMRRTRPDQRQKIQEEAKLLSRLENRHVVGYITSYLLGDSFIIVTEYCEGGDLGEYLEKAGKPLPEDLVVCWTAQIAKALKVRPLTSGGCQVCGGRMTSRKDFLPFFSADSVSSVV